MSTVELTILFVPVFAAAWLLLTYAFLFAAGVGDDIQHLDRFMRIVTVNDQLTTLRLAVGPILDDDSEARSGMELCRKRIIDQLEVTTFSAEGYARHIELAIANVADGERLLCDAAIDFAKVSRPVYGEAACGGVARHYDDVRTGGIVA